MPTKVFYLFSAIIGSGDSNCSRTAVRISKQHPKEGKCSIEMILGMSEMVESLLEYNRRLNGELPKKILFYRDGKHSTIVIR